jgi:hypothetical protein
VNQYVEELGKKSEQAAGPPTSQQQPSLPEGSGTTDSKQETATTETEKEVMAKPSASQT